MIKIGLPEYGHHKFFSFPTRYGILVERCIFCLRDRKILEYEKDLKCHRRKIVKNLLNLLPL